MQIDRFFGNIVKFRDTPKRPKSIEDRVIWLRTTILQRLGEVSIAHGLDIADWKSLSSGYNSDKNQIEIIVRF